MAHWYLYDGGDGYFQKEETLKAAIASGEVCIKEYREQCNCYDGWPEYVDEIYVYRCDRPTEEPMNDGVVVYCSTEIILEERPDDLDEDGFSKSTGYHWGPDIQTISDFKMQPVNQNT